MFTQAQLNVIRYCAEEVKRQGDGPVNVYDMVNAWSFANEWQPFRVGDSDKRLQIPITKEFIQQIVHMVEPTENPNGFRTIPIFVGSRDGWNLSEKTPPERITVMLEVLIASYYEGNLAPDKVLPLYRGAEDWGNYKYYKKAKTAEDIFYFEFENIHPFKDGNGRTGKVLYNYLLGTLDNPIMPPNFWGSANP